ncbi:putative non-specific serine/threonine protein kinase [Helianthus debilis subsp. tardiflorus]
MLDSHKIQKEDNLFATFSYFDKDGSGYITAEELRQACVSFGLGDIPLNEVMDEIDKDHDRRIGYNEFVDMMEGFWEEHQTCRLTSHNRHLNS